MKQFVIEEMLCQIQCNFTSKRNTFKKLELQKKSLFKNVARNTHILKEHERVKGVCDENAEGICMLILIGMLLPCDFAPSPPKSQRTEINTKGEQ